MNIADIAPALIGIGGVAIGGTIQWVAATRAQRVQFILKVNEQREAFYVRALRAADDLNAAHTREYDDFTEQQGRPPPQSEAANDQRSVLRYERTEAIEEQIRRATSEWREVFMSRYLYVSAQIEFAIIRLESSRVYLIDGWKYGRTAVVDDMYWQFAVDLQRLRAAVGLALARDNARATHQMTHFWQRSTRRDAALAIKRSRKAFEQFDSETVAEP